MTAATGSGHAQRCSRRSRSPLCALALPMDPASSPASSRSRSPTLPRLGPEIGAGREGGGRPRGSPELPSPLARASPRAGKRDQDQAIDITRFWVWKAGDSRGITPGRGQIGNDVRHRHGPGGGETPGYVFMVCSFKDRRGAGQPQISARDRRGTQVPAGSPLAPSRRKRSFAGTPVLAAASRCAPMKAERPITARRRIQTAGFTASCARGARLQLPKTPEGAIFASQPMSVKTSQKNRAGNIPRFDLAMPDAASCLLKKGVAMTTLLLRQLRPDERAAASPSIPAMAKSCCRGRHRLCHHDQRLGGSETVFVGRPRRVRHRQQQ